MKQQELVLAEILRRGARALAAYAAEEVASQNGQAMLDCSAAQFDGWQNLLAARLEDLAVSIATEKPRLFVEQVLWTKAALTARGVTPDCFKIWIEALGRVLQVQMPAEFKSLATQHLQEALVQWTEETVAVKNRLEAQSADERLAARYLVAVLEGDRRGASRLILEAADSGKTAEHLYLKVLQPAQQELGRMWLLGEINVAEEHFATATTRFAMAQLSARTECRPANGKTLIAAAVAGNQHDLGIQMVADLFEFDGWRTIALGANLPPEDLAQAVEFYNADLVALSLTMVNQFPALEKTIATVRHGNPKIKILVGGCKVPAIDDIASTIRADAYAEDASEAVRKGNELVSLI